MADRHLKVGRASPVAAEADCAGGVLRSAGDFTGVGAGALVVDSGVDAGVADGEGLGVDSGVSAGVADGEGLGVDSGVSVGVADGEGLGVDSGVSVGVANGEGLGEGVV